MSKNYMDSWQELLKADHLPDALYQHFRYLIEKEVSGFEPVLKAIMQEVLEVEIKDDTLVLVFPDGEFLRASSPCYDAEKKYIEWPQSFQRIMQTHETLKWGKFHDEDYFDGLLELGDHNRLNEDTFEGWENEEIWSAWLANYLSPMRKDGYDFWLYHPEERNPTGESRIYYLDAHEGENLEDASLHNIGGVFLAQMVEDLNLEIELPSGISDEVVQPWWDTLDDSWKKVIESNTKKKNLDAAKAILRQNKLTIDENSGITSLEPILFLKDIELLRCNEKNIQDIAPLIKLHNLKGLSLHSNIIKDFSPLQHLDTLEDLDLSGTNIDNISCLKALTRLSNLNLAHSEVEDIKPLSFLKELSELNLSATKVTDVTPLASLTKLQLLNISNTDVKHLEPLLPISKKLNLICYDAPVYFREVLKIKENQLPVPKREEESLPDDEDEDDLIDDLLDDDEEDEDDLIDDLLNDDEEDLSDVLSDRGSIHSVYNTSLEIFIEAVKNIDFPLESMENALAEYTNAHLLSIIKSEDRQDLVSQLLTAYLQLPHKKVTGKWLEELAGNAVAVTKTANLEPQVVQAILTQMIPDEPQNITLSLLAFNLACYYAGERQKDLMLKYMAQALKLGHERIRFESDSDFAAYQSDPDFQKIIKQPAMPDPEEDPVGWFNSLPKSIKEYFIWEGNRNGIKEFSSDAIRSLIESENFSLHLQSPKNLDYLYNLIHLKSLTIVGSKATSIEVLATLTNLRSFECEHDIYLSKVQYSDLTPLCGLQHLTSLKLRSQAFEDISPLINLTHLENLDLWDNPVKSLEPLKELVHLKRLYCTSVNDLQTTIFQSLVKLTLIDLDMSGNTIDSLEGLTNAENLEYLSIREAKSGQGEHLSLQPLAKLKHLKGLRLRNVPLTDIETLFSINTLKELLIDKAYLTNDLRKALRTHLPECSIDSW